MNNQNQNTDKKAPAKSKLSRLTVRSNVKAGLGTTLAGCTPCHRPS